MVRLVNGLKTFPAEAPGGRPSAPKTVREAFQVVLRQRSKGSVRVGFMAPQKGIVERSNPMSETKSLLYWRYVSGMGVQKSSTTQPVFESSSQSSNYLRTLKESGTTPEIIECTPSFKTEAFTQNLQLPQRETETPKASYEAIEESSINTTSISPILSLRESMQNYRSQLPLSSQPSITILIFP